jgi:hypothetical protein
MKHKQRIFFVLLRWLMVSAVVLCCGRAFAFDTLTASVDKNPVMADESITLTVVANASLPRDVFDTSVLEQDFKVIRTSVSSQTQIVNLSRTVSTTWTTLLFPRREGLIRIPPININNILSDPIELMVMPAGQNANQEMRDIFMSTSLLPENGYVMQQFTYTVKLYLAVELERGSLQVPAIDNVMMEQIGEDTETNIIQNGKRYRVVERKYSLIPQQSGALTIPSPIFEGSVRTRNRGSFGGLFNPSKAVNQLGPEINLNVQPIPADYPYPWLPSEFVQINEAWSADPNEFIVGEPMTRTITLSALGVDQSVLPDLDLQLPPDLKAYPDQAQLNSVVKDDNVIAQRVENYAVVPSRVGNFVLPEITVPWFNTLTGDTEFARIAPRSIKVQPNAATSSTTIAPIMPQNITAPTAEPVAATLTQPWYQQTLLWQISSAVLLLLFTASILLRPTRTAPSSPSQTAEAPNEKASYKALLSVVQQQQSERIEAALCVWLAHWYPTQPVLAKYPAQVGDSEFSEWVNTFYSKRYSGYPLQHDDYARLTRWLTKARKDLTDQAQVQLPPLYPE